MIGSPSNLELLLHCYYSRTPHERLHAPAIQEGIQYLLQEGMIEPGTVPDSYGATAKAEAFIEHLLAVPFPEAKWIVPQVAP
jgi:hypothetical protein